MSAATSSTQAALAAAIVASTAGTYVALSPPRSGSRSRSTAASTAGPMTTPTDDTIASLHLASQTTTNAVMAPLGLLSLHTAGLALSYPAVPPWLLRHGAEAGWASGGTSSGLASECVTWSAATAIPLALILCVGVPLRLCSYASLGGNFSFKLAPPDRLTTTGIYRYVQHPSYVGVQVLVASNAALLCRADGVLSCWTPPAWRRAVRVLAWALAAAGMAAFSSAAWVRVRQEEQMLQAKFGAEWERWHAETARFVPFLF